MITSFVLGLLADVCSWVAGLFPVWATPSWVGATASTIAGWVSGLGALGYFLPLPAIAASLAIVLACSGVALAIRFTRIAASFLTLGGGM